MKMRWLSPSAAARDQRCTDEHGEDGGFGDGGERGGEVSVEFGGEFSGEGGEGGVVVLRELDEVGEVDIAIVGEVAFGPFRIGGIVVLGDGDEVGEVDEAVEVGVADDRLFDEEAVGGAGHSDVLIWGG